MASESRRTSPLLLTAALLVLLAGLAVVLPRLSAHLAANLDDFVEYWAAARLNAHGHNPYSAELLFDLQREAGWQRPEPVMMWNPPWTLPLVMPFGLLPYPMARVAWLLLSLALVLGSVDLLWQTYGGPPELRWLAWLAALVFAPTIISLRMGQIPPVMLAGLAGFLCLVQRERPLLAGLCLALTAIKPQQAFLMWIALVLWSLHGRQFRILLGAGLGLGLGSLAALATNPDVLHQYQQAATSRPPLDFISTSFGTLLRLAAGWRHSQLQFVPPLIGAAWLLPYWWRRRDAWSWLEETPLLLLVSILASAYGWLGDQVVLLVAVVPMAVAALRLPAHGRRVVFGLFVALSLLDLAINAFVKDLDGFQELLHLWTAPALLAGFLMLRFPATVRLAATR